MSQPDFLPEPDDQGLDSEPSSKNSIYDLLGYSRSFEIPKILHSVEKDGLFTHCIHCNADLLRSDRPYMIEKIFRGKEAIIELAMCFDCREKQQSEGMSEESLKSIQNFFRSSVGLRNRLELMMNKQESETIDPWLDHCLLSNLPASQFNEYQIVAICRGDKIQCDVFPAFLSGPAMEELESLLSEQTRGWMDDYLGSNFGMPSEFCEPPSFTPVLL